MSKITKSAIEELRSIPYEQQRLESLKRELEAIDNALYSPRGAGISSVPTLGGGNRQEEKIVGILSDPRRERLKRLISIQSAHIKAIDDSLRLFTATEYKIISLWYLNPSSRPMSEAMEQTGYSDAQINRIKYAALKKYAYARALDTKLMTKT